MRIAAISLDSATRPGRVGIRTNDNVTPHVGPRTRPDLTEVNDSVAPAVEPVRHYGHALEPGPRIGGYIVQAEMAIGGFAAVYYAEHAVLGRHVAIKVMHPDLSRSPELVERFKREAQATNIIQHPNIVDIYDFGRLADGRPYFIMEFLAGVDLAAYLRRHGRMAPYEVISILEPLCSALTAAHGAGIVHRDLKASNVFLADHDGGCRVVLLDFGIAKLLDDRRTGLSTVGRPIGTPSCMAPEQLRGAPVDVRTDVYALGCLTFNMLTGEVPFVDDSPIVVQQMHLTARPPRPSAKAPVPPALDQVVLRAMSKDVSDRYHSAGAFLDAVRDAADRPGHRRRPPTAQSMWAIALHVEVTVSASDFDDLDDALLLDMESILDIASARMQQRGFLVALQCGNALALVRPLPGGKADTGAREAGVQAAVVLANELRQRETRDDRVQVNLCLHCDRATIAGTRVIGGAIMRLAAWVPQQPLSGVVGSPAVFAGLETLATEPIPGDPGWLRIVETR